MSTNESPDWKITWVDGKREPKHPPNPKYPTGIDLDLTHGHDAADTCFSALPYPAARCGHYRIECRRCGQGTIVTTAGRIDDPRSLKLACKQLA
jgi:hypothetical protein